MELDEISWLGRYDETFADMVKIAWDNYLSLRDWNSCPDGSLGRWCRKR